MTIRVGVRTAWRGLTTMSIAVIASVLVGCASIPPAPEWSPPAAATPLLAVGDGARDPNATTTDQPSTDPPATTGDESENGNESENEGESEPATTVSAGPPALTGTGVAGLDVRLLYAATEGSPVAARWAEIPGNPAFTGMIRGRVADAIAAHAGSTGIPYAPAADAPAITPEKRGCVPGSSTRPATELIADAALTPPGGAASLTVTCDLVAAAGNVMVEALRITTAVGGQVTSDETTVYYTETSGAFVTTSDTFLTDDGLRILLADSVQSLKVSAGALEPAMRQNPADFPADQLRTLFSHLSFTADGSLRIHLPDSFTTPELDALGTLVRPEPLFVTVPAATATPLLSPEAQQIQSVLASGAPLTLPAAPLRGQESVDCTFFACVAVTFDDGLGQYTSGVLDDLDARRAAATFFVQGYRVGQSPAVLRRMNDEGHEIGNHSWNHPDLTKLTDPEIADQLRRTSQAIRDALGTGTGTGPGTIPSTFRPPYGAVDPRVLAQTTLPAILWSIDTNDWQIPDDATLLDRAVTKPASGAIILLHDVHENTARMVPSIVDGLQGRGFTLVTVQQLLGGTVPAAHTTTQHG
ncbi:polysaccharide deacetylase family protein [Herbiconiux solani]|uniref:polysaccharide deacetylase family protein n=1 Tax=Herbiconiux solani TaxID=661329 RepID=UPI0008253F76|nr:polysaccharide deacetylase family protein [Herbiconiux solani]